MDLNGQPLIASQQTVFHRVKVNYKATAEPRDQTHEGISSFFWSLVTIVSHLMGFVWPVAVATALLLLLVCPTPLFARNHCLG